MHIFTALVLLLGALALIYLRMRAANMLGERAVDDDIRTKTRKMMYDTTRNGHPADEVSDPRLAAAGVVVAIASMDQPIRQSEIGVLSQASQEVFGVTEREALDIVSFGRWLADQCESQEDAVERLVAIVASEAGPEAGPDLVKMIEDVATAEGNTLGQDERAALAVVRAALDVQ